MCLVKESEPCDHSVRQGDCCKSADAMCVCHVDDLILYIYRGGSSGVGGALTTSTTNFDSTTFEKGPQIDTWTNETAEKPTEKEDIGGRCLMMVLYTATLNVMGIFSSHTIPDISCMFCSAMICASLNLLSTLDAQTRH